MYEYYPFIISIVDLVDFLVIFNFFELELSVEMYLIKFSLMIYTQVRN